jgi:peptidoglycan/LPS O-acetylase OafA/YrhL
MVFPVIGEFAFRGQMPEVLALTLIFTFAIAAVSYALVESPCREALRGWESRRTQRPASAIGGGVSQRQEDAIAP